MKRLRHPIALATIGLFLVLFFGTGKWPHAAEETQPANQEKGAPAKLELRVGDHISIIGNTLADRMQHDGWLETYLHAQFPKHDLVIRNLGYSGDELTVRL